MKRVEESKIRAEIHIHCADVSRRILRLPVSSREFIDRLHTLNLKIHLSTQAKCNDLYGTQQLSHYLNVTKKSCMVPHYQTQ